MAIQAAIGDDFDVPIGEQHVDQHSIVRFGVPYTERGKYLERALPGLLPGPDFARLERSFDGESDLAAVRQFARGNRPLDRLERLDRKYALEFAARGAEMTE